VQPFAVLVSYQGHGISFNLFVFAFAAAAFQFDQLCTDGIGDLFEFSPSKMVGVNFEIHAGHSGNPEARGFGSVFDFLPFTIKYLSAHGFIPFLGLSL
jgi:hypothetical protein